MEELTESEVETRVEKKAYEHGWVEGKQAGAVDEYTDGDRYVTEILPQLRAMTLRESWEDCELASTVMSETTVPAFHRGVGDYANNNDYAENL